MASVESVDTVKKIGLSAEPDDKVLLAAENYDVFVTADKNIECQHRSGKFKTPRYVLPTTSWPKLQGKLDEIIAGIMALCPNRPNCDLFSVDE